MFQPHVRRSSPVGSILRLVRLNLSKPAKIAPFPGFKTARPSNPSEALPSKKYKSPAETKSRETQIPRQNEIPQNADSNPASEKPLKNSKKIYNFCKSPVVICGESCYNKKTVLHVFFPCGLGRSA